MSHDAVVAPQYLLHPPNAQLLGQSREAFDVAEEVGKAPLGAEWEWESGYSLETAEATVPGSIGVPPVVVNAASGQRGCRSNFARPPGAWSERPGFSRVGSHGGTGTGLYNEVLLGIISAEYLVAEYLVA